MKDVSAKYLAYMLCSVVALVSFNASANSYEQPEIIQDLNGPQTFRTGHYRDPKNDPNYRPQPNGSVDKEDHMPEITDEIIEDVLREYPEIAARVELLQDDDATGNFKPKNLLGNPDVGKLRSLWLLRWF